MANSTPLAIGERIVWMADNGPEFGTVRWIGILKDVSEDWTVGVEFDHAVGTGTGKYRNEQLFRTRMNHASLVPVVGLVKEADFLGNHSSAIAATNLNVLSGNGGRGNVDANLPVFNEVQLDLVANRISKYEWSIIANHLKIPPTVLALLGDVGVIAILRWWWQSGCMCSFGASSRLSLLIEALSAAGKYDFAAELNSSFAPDKFWPNAAAAAAAMTNVMSFANGIELNQDSPLMSPD